MFTKAGIIALAIGASLVSPVSFADAQIALVNQKFEAFKQASIGGQPSSVLVIANLQQSLLASFGARPVKDAAVFLSVMNTQVAVLGQATQQRDRAAQELATAIDQTMNSNNQEDAKRLEQIFDEIQAINKTTSDALLSLSDLRASVEERVAAGAQNQ